MNDYETLKSIIELLTEDGYIRNRDKQIAAAKNELAELGVNIDDIWNDEIDNLLRESPKIFLETDVFKKMVNTVYQSSTEKEKFFKMSNFTRKKSFESIIFNAIDDIERKKEYLKNHPYQLRYWIREDALIGEDIKSVAFVEMIKNNIYDIESVEGMSNYKNLELDLSNFEEIYESIMKDLNSQPSYRIEDITFESIEKIYGCISSKTKMEFLLSNVSKVAYDENYRKTEAMRIQMSSIYDTLTEKEQEEVLAQLPDNFSKAKLLYATKKMEKGNILNVLSDFSNDLEKGNANIENFKIKLAMHNIDFDDVVKDASFYEIQNKEEFFNSQEFSDLINKYYENLSDDEKREFYDKLGFSTNNNDYITWYADEKPDVVKKIFDVNLAILSKIQDNSKFDYMSRNFKYGLLVTGIIEEPKTQFEIIVKMLEESVNYNVEPVITAMKKLNRLDILAEIEMEPEEIGKVFNNLYNKSDGGSNNKYIAIVLSSLISKESIKKYLETKPSEVYNIIDSYNAAFFEKLDVDEFYKAKLLLGSNAKFSHMDKFFWQIDDEYLRTQILLSKHSEGIKSVKEANGDIDKYEMIKQEFLNLPTQDEKVNYLANCHEGKTLEDVQNVYKKINDMTKSLLKYIDNHDDRMKIIDSMMNYVQPEIKPYSDLAESMIKEFFEDNGGLTEEMQERMKTVFRSMDFFMARGYSSPDVTGECKYLYSDISVVEHRKKEPEKLLLDLIHEISHGFSNANYKSTGNHIGHTIEEGMADIFSETVLNHYFQKHKAVEIDGRKIEPKLPLKSTSTYYKENAYTRTMMYPLSQNGKDIEALKEFELGEKSKYIELVFGEEFLKNCNKNFVGVPDHVSVNYGDIYSAHSEGFQIKDKTSLYERKNYLLPALHMQAKMDEKRNKR